MKRNSNITSVGRSSVILMVETQRIHTGEKFIVINDKKKRTKTMDMLADLGQVTMTSKTSFQG